ncbi:MAG: helix-hairpin-helix domain-containing protein [Bacteroidota bacterium]
MSIRVYARWIICIALLFIGACKGLAQTAREPEEKMVADLLERLIENQESTVDYTDLQEQLEYYLQHKLDLNKADRSQLERLVFLSDKDINALLQHRNEFGDYLTIYELQTIEVLDERTLYYLSYFVSVDVELNDDHTPFLQCLQKGKHEILALHENDFQTKAGYNTELREQGKSYYLGSPYRYVLRYRFNYNSKLSLGYAGEKDMGEQFFQGTQRSGFDFNSVHFFMRNMGKWKAIALGDYQASFGQGVTFGSGQAARKSAYVLNARRSFQALRPYRSLNENEFLRGMAATYAFRHLEVTLIGSRKYISTNFQNADTLIADDGNFSSIQLTGLHRTQTETATKNNVLQTMYGGHITYKSESFELGLTAVSAMYNKRFEAGDKPYQLYNFSGTQLTNMGVDYQFQLRNSNVFGESSMSDNGAPANILGLNIPLHQLLDMVFVYRNYSKKYQATFHNPFGENTDGKNEEGLYSGLSLKPKRGWLLNMYFDWYRSPWLRYLTDAPSRGTDYLVELQYNPNKQSQFYIRYRHELKNKNQSDNISIIDYTSFNQREQYRVHAQYKISDNLTSKSRLEMLVYTDELSGKQQGSLIFQDMLYTHPQKRFTLATRIAIFSVDDYNARIYATEQDVLYQYAVPLYQNSGIRYYAVAHIKLHKRLDVWFKCSHTEYSNVKTISSGLEKINGNRLSDLRVQIRVGF